MKINEVNEEKKKKFNWERNVLRNEKEKKKLKILK
jgi:hypothetical protein